MDNFDSIIKNQFSPRAWYDLGLIETFPHLDQHSMIAFLGIQMATKLAALSERRSELEADPATRHGDGSEPQALRLAGIHRQIFDNLYSGIQGSLEELWDRGEKPVLYHEFVGDACRTQLELVRELDDPASTKQELSAYVDMLGFFYQNESDRQFLKLQEVEG